MVGVDRAAEVDKSQSENKSSRFLKSALRTGMSIVKLKEGHTSISNGIVGHKCRIIMYGAGWKNRIVTGGILLVHQHMQFYAKRQMEEMSLPCATTDFIWVMYPRRRIPAVLAYSEGSDGTVSSLNSHICSYQVICCNQTLWLLQFGILASQTSH